MIYHNDQKKKKDLFWCKFSVKSCVTENSYRPQYNAENVLVLHDVDEFISLWKQIWRKLHLCITFTFMHLADAFIQSDLQLHSGYTFSLVCVFPGNRTHNLLRCWRNALPLSHTGTPIGKLALHHQWTLCSEWVPSEWESKQLIKYITNDW